MDPKKKRGEKRYRGERTTIHFFLYFSKIWQPGEREKEKKELAEESFHSSPSLSSTWIASLFFLTFSSSGSNAVSICPRCTRACGNLAAAKRISPPHPFLVDFFFYFFFFCSLQIWWVERREIWRPGNRSLTASRWGKWNAASTREGGGVYFFIFSSTRGAMTPERSSLFLQCNDYLPTLLLSPEWH